VSDIVIDTTQVATDTAMNRGGDASTANCSSSRLRSRSPLGSEGLRVQILETDSDAVYRDSRLPPDHYWRLGWCGAALTGGEIIFADTGCENESSEFQAISLTLQPLARKWT
jgi:hypothetical protein